LSRSSTPPWVAGVGGGRCPLPAGSERGHRGLGDGLVLFTGATADPDGADDLALVLQRYPTREDHDPSLVGDVDAEELRTGLCVAGQFTGRDVEGTGGEGRSEEHTSELQSRENLVCRLLLEKKKNQEST